MRQLALFFQMALRNAIKYKRRSLQSGFAVFIGVFLIAVGNAYIAGFSGNIVDGAIKESGHLAVMAPGYAERAEMMPLDTCMENSDAAETALREVDPALRTYASIMTSGLVSRADESDLTATIVCRGARFLDRGLLLPAFSRLRLESGRLPVEGERGMVLTQKAARKIGATAGKNIVYLASDRYGGFNVIEIPLVGILSDGTSFSGDACLMDLESARRLTGIEAGSCEISVYAIKESSGAMMDPREATAILAAAEAKARDLGLDTLRWDQASGSLASMLEFMDLFMYVMYALFAIVAIVGITNSVLLSVQDRIRDFGTLRAIAFTKNGVSMMIVAETLVVGALASLVAVSMALVLATYLQVNALTLPEAIRDVAGWMPADIRPLVVPIHFLVSFLAGALIPVLATVYPIGMIRRMSVREALGYA
jgi:putative ABC transport system permease protein